MSNDTFTEMKSTFELASFNLRDKFAIEKWEIVNYLKAVPDFLRKVFGNQMRNSCETF